MQTKTKAERLAALDADFDSADRGQMALPEFLRRRSEIEREPDPPKPSPIQLAMDGLVERLKAYVGSKLVPLEEQARGSSERLDKHRERIDQLEARMAELERRGDGT